MVKIYLLRDPDTNLARYVGKTVNLKLRLANHLCPSALSKGHHRARWLSKLVSEGKKPIVYVIEEVEDLLADERERFWIKTLKVSGCDLTNTTDGGEGGSTTKGRKRGPMPAHVKAALLASQRPRTEEELKIRGRKIADNRAKNGTTNKGRVFGTPLIIKS